MFCIVEEICTARGVWRMLYHGRFGRCVVRGVFFFSFPLLDYVEIDGFADLLVIKGLEWR
jgi:hypothetical protein